jgi:ribosomal-protein-alanine N-acetyltransferase
VPPVVPSGGMCARPQPTLAASGEIQLRPWEDGDAPAVEAAFQDPAIRHWHLRRIESHEEALEWIAGWPDRWNAETDAGWAVVDRRTGEPLGQAALRTANLAFGSAQVTYWVVRAARGRGVASAAAREVARWALEDLGLHRLSIHHSVQNDASCKVAERARFPLEATMRSALLHDDGWHDMHVHARLADRGWT